MILDRPLVFEASEVNFNSTQTSGHYSEGAGPVRANQQGSQNPVRRLPF